MENKDINQYFKAKRGEYKEDGKESLVFYYDKTTGNLRSTLNKDEAKRNSAPITTLDFI